MLSRMKSALFTFLRPLVARGALLLLLVASSCSSGENAGDGGAGSAASNDGLVWDDPDTTWDNANWQ